MFVIILDIDRFLSEKYITFSDVIISATTKILHNRIIIIPFIIINGQKFKTSISATSAEYQSPGASLIDIKSTVKSAPREKT
ncbi:hypothetical protein L2E82_17998 [Cichorium intybus]|uniref:Uncharacterized protein n=1 Tax=Cichorium intybus TaxID=13427 RepID=A0ACB9FA23_CICIN|nr:hypothetical protein L2E82_17998 [Cichorium intybus]